MPYIKCKDGKTYSRYDESDYVKKCICEEQKAIDNKFAECMADPKCRSEYEVQQAREPYLILGSLLIIILIFFALIRHITRVYQN